MHFIISNIICVYLDKFLICIFLHLEMYLIVFNMFADAHCTRLVQKGIVDKLVTVLCSEDPAEGDITLQHATLSALRNLAIPSKYFLQI